MRPGCLVALGNNMFRHRPQLTLSLSLLSLLLYLLFGEVGVHTAYSWGWAWPTSSAHHPHVPLDPTITDTNENYRVITATSEETISSTKILVLADPHIQCSFDRYEPWLFRLDSDWYVGRAVSRLVARLQPHVVVIVGDVFAEGYKASEFEWQDYLQCLRDVLVVPNDVRLLLLPGDNDIGGEGAEAMKKIVNERYTTQFGPLNEVISLNGFTLVKLNTVSYIHSHPVGQEEGKVRGESGSFLRGVAESASRGLLRRPVLVFSHVPFSELQSRIASETFLMSLTPDYIFSGHTHRHKHTTHTYTTSDSRKREALEWTVPTCSYRMGEAHMGVGAIFIDRHGNLGYSVLSLPPRYPFLISYLFLTLLLITILTLSHFTRCQSR